MAATRVTVDAGAVLAGSGTIAADVTVGGTLGYGPLRISGSLDFRAGSIWDVRVVSQEAADLLAVDGVAGGTVTLQIAAPAGAVPVNLPILTASAASTFAGFAPQNAGTWSIGEAPAGTLRLTMPQGDSDGDHLPDAWELEYFSSRTAATPDGDADGDHASNLAEYAAGTLPGDGDSVLRMTSLTRAGSGWDLTWPGVAGRVYRVAFTLAPAVPETVLGDDIAGTPPVNFFHVEPPTNQPAWLKVEVIP
ncbi:MAG: hypothetical protein U1F77_07590 [Kiritimatiellia bacterium]